MNRIPRSFIAIAILAVITPSALAAGSVLTRFGTLNIGGQFDNVLLLKGHAIVKAINALSVSDRFRLGRKDILLLKETGGAACPALYYFVTVTPSGAKSTRAFGTCGELSHITRTGNRIELRMPGFRGPFEPAAERQKAEAQTHVFVFRNGRVAENRGATVNIRH
jgi:hypothetical protein